MTHKAAAETVPPTQPHRHDLLGIAYLGTIAIVMLAWISGLVWGTIAFFTWLVS